MRLLMIEDDAQAARSLELILRVEDFSVDSTSLGEEGIDLAKLYDYDVVLLDLNLPDMGGLEVLRALRVAKVRTPVMVISGAVEVASKLQCFAAGADEYITKPFHKAELVARINAVARRARGHAQVIIDTGDIRVNLHERSVLVCGERVHVTHKEYQLLELLSLRKGFTLTKDMFMSHLYNGLDDPEMKIIDVFMCKLRKKLSGAGVEGAIETVWGRGYVLRDPAETQVAA